MTRGPMHPQADVIHTIFGKNRTVAVSVDALLVPILIPLWDRGIVTRYSCQGINKGDMPEAPDHVTPGYIAFDEKHLDAMRGMMLTFFPRRKLRWECDDSRFETTYGYPRPTGPMFTVRFPKLKDRR